MSDSAAAARQLWALFEPVHAVTYFTAEGRAAFEQAGLRGFWRGYFAGRAAPIGAVGAPPVIAAFFSFAPAMVARALPAVWQLITPERALLVRSEGAVAGLGRLLGLAAGEPVTASIETAASLLAAAIEDIDGAGRPLGGPNAAQPIPAAPLARLWHAATVLREHRGDGHVAALVAAGLDGCEALALRSGVELARSAAGDAGGRARGPAGRGWFRDEVQPARGWTDDEWEAAAGRLADQGWLDPRGAATAAGLAAHLSIEAATDLAAGRPWARLGRDRTEELARLLGPVSQAASAALPLRNPIGIPGHLLPDASP
ncbi:MAG: SCO6745 family protein [Streptosporangiaceae bacterium]